MVDVRRFLEQVEAANRLVILVTFFGVAHRVVQERQLALARWEDDGGAIR